MKLCTFIKMKTLPQPRKNSSVYFSLSSQMIIIAACNKQDCDYQLAFQLYSVSDKISSGDQIFQGHLIHTWKAGKRKETVVKHWPFCFTKHTLGNHKQNFCQLLATSCNYKTQSAWDMDVGCYAACSSENKLKCDSS